MVRRRRSPKDSTTHRNHRRAFAGAFKTAPLFEAYDIYQHLMDYWAHIMEDDCYLVAAEGWKAGAQPREIDAHCKSICEALAPVGALEIDIAQAIIAEDRWRLKRARAIETGIFAAGRQGLLGFNPGVATTEDAPSFSSKIPSSKPALGSPRTTISCFSLSMSSASTAR